MGEKVKDNVTSVDYHRLVPSSYSLRYIVKEIIKVKGI